MPYLAEFKFGLLDKSLRHCSCFGLVMFLSTRVCYVFEDHVHLNHLYGIYKKKLVSRDISSKAHEVG